MPHKREIRSIIEQVEAALWRAQGKLGEPVQMQREIHEQRVILIRLALSLVQDERDESGGMRKEPCRICGVPTATIGPTHDVYCQKHH